MLWGAAEGGGGGGRGVCLLLAPVVKDVDTFTFGDDGDGAAVLVRAHAADGQVRWGCDMGWERGAAWGGTGLPALLPEVHPQMLLGALAPVVLLNLRVEAHVVEAAHWSEAHEQRCKRQGA